MRKYEGTATVRSPEVTCRRRPPPPRRARFGPGVSYRDGMASSSRADIERLDWRSRHVAPWAWALCGGLLTCLGMFVAFPYRRDYPAHALMGYAGAGALLVAWRRPPVWAGALAVAAAAVAAAAFEMSADRQSADALDVVATVAGAAMAAVAWPRRESADAWGLMAVAGLLLGLGLVIRLAPGPLIP